MTRKEKAAIRDIIARYYCATCLVYTSWEAADELLKLIGDKK